MQVVILAGGLGSRLSEETESKPKPMVEIGDRPMLAHIMGTFADQGFDRFLIALGYLGHVVKRYFIERATSAGDMDIDLATGRVQRLDGAADSWRVRLVETGLHTQTGGRLRRLAPQIDGERFLLTYGDGLADVDLRALLAFHLAHGRAATLTAVRPLARFGALDLDESADAGCPVRSFMEKAQLREGWINGGFMVLERRVLDLIDGDDAVLERDVLPRLAEAGDLCAYRHDGFWHCMDTLRDVRVLRELAARARPPWRL